MKKKIFNCLVMALVMALVFVGCSNGTAVTTDPARGGEDPTNIVTTAATEATGAPTEPENQDSTEPTGPVETTPDEPTGNPGPATDPDNTTQNPKPPVENHTHSYTESVVKPTCESKGYTLHKCSCGDSYKDTETAALGHSYSEKVVAPTTENKGYTEHVCGSCGDSYKDNYTDKLPAACQHNWKSKYYPEEGHYTDYFVVCKCGAKFNTTEEWIAHSKGYTGEEAVLQHGGWGSTRFYVVDSPERWEWTCTKCGEVTDTKP